MFVKASNKQLVTDAEAEKIDANNHKVWDAFWSKPRSERTAADWEALFNIEIMVRA